MYESDAQSGSIPGGVRVRTGASATEGCAPNVDRSLSMEGTEMRATRKVRNGTYMELSTQDGTTQMKRVRLDWIQRLPAYFYFAQQVLR